MNNPVLDVNKKIGPIQLLSGKDPSLLSDALTELLKSVDRTTDFHELNDENYTIDDIISAIKTPPLFAERRTVVSRGLERFNSSALQPLIEYAESPNEDSALVLTWGSSSPPQKLLVAIQEAGGFIINTMPSMRSDDRVAWIRECLGATHMEFENRTIRMIDKHLGEDLSSLSGLIKKITTAFPHGATLSPNDVQPFLGSAGGVPPWDLTDAIDSSDSTKALKVLQRMWHAGQDPLRIMGYLTNHYSNAMRLDGAVKTESEAVNLLTPKINAYPARKAFRLGRRLGSNGMRRAISRLSQADINMRGGSSLDNQIIMEVLVGRLSSMRRK